jgi:hypothetical protein
MENIYMVPIKRRHNMLSFLPESWRGEWDMCVGGAMAQFNASIHADWIYLYDDSNIKQRNYLSAETLEVEGRWTAIRSNQLKNHLDWQFLYYFDPKNIECLFCARELAWDEHRASEGTLTHFASPVLRSKTLWLF